MPLKQVNLYAALRKISQHKTIELQVLDGPTVNGILVALIDRYPEMLESLLNGSGELDNHAHIYINGRDCRLLENALETNLSPEDTVDIFPIGHF